MTGILPGRRRKGMNWMDNKSAASTNIEQEVIGASLPFQNALNRVRVIAPTDSVTLIQGETGFFYGPGTWYSNDGAAADLLCPRALPLIGEGTAVNSFIRVEDAACATVAALTAAPGIYNIVDDDPMPVAEWLPAFAQSVGAPSPRRMSEEEALAAAGPDVVFYHNNLSGARNGKAKA